MSLTWGERCATCSGSSRERCVRPDEAKAAVGALAFDLDRTQREAEANAMPELTAAQTEQINAWRRL